MDPIRVVVAGYGFLGTYHTQKVQLCTKAQLVAIVENYEKNKKRAEEDYPDIIVVDKLEELAVDTYDAVLIVTPTYSHKKLIEQCIKNNIHIFCEKPMCTNYNQAMQIKYPKENIVFQIGHSERFHSIFNKQEKVNIWTVAGDIVGDQDAFVQFTRKAPYKGRGLDVSVISDLMIHDIDLMLFLFPDIKEPVIKNTISNNLLVKENINKINPDFVKVNINCKNTFKQFEITAARGCHDEVRNITVWSDYGVLYIDLLSRSMYITRNGQVQKIKYPKNDHLFLEQLAFYDSIYNNKPAVVTVSDALLALSIMHQIENELQII